MKIVSLRRFLFYGRLLLSNPSYVEWSRVMIARTKTSQNSTISTFFFELFLIEEIELRKCTVKINCLFWTAPHIDWYSRPDDASNVFVIVFFFSPDHVQRFLSQFDVELKSHEGKNLFSRIPRNRNVVKQSS